MKLRMMLIVAFGCTVATATAQDDELGKLEGKWKMTRYERAGGEKALLKNNLATFAGGKFTFAYGKGLGVKLDATKSPKEIDLLNAGMNKRETWKGIYELQGDTLKLCVATGSDQTRPKEFTTKGADSATMYFIYQRMK